jgi:hypothetical protein
MEDILQSVSSIQRFGGNFELMTYISVVEEN